ARALQEWLRDASVPAVLLNADAPPAVPGDRLIYGDPCGAAILQKPLQPDSEGPHLSREYRPMVENSEQILLKYFTREQVKHFKLSGDTATFRDAAFFVDRRAGTIQWSAAPDDEFLNGQLGTLPRDQATWALVAFIKVRYFDDPAGVIARA